ncbi:hypothetical protein [Chitinophaga sp. CB10]|uniref:hypothetical protein n=1 Tax=Chitinophaga sp. CB10 TaxID=1891659 RepID=UPI0025C25490|nr:hypothetical protein [Chitinophaga sp. CB10]
MKNKIRIILSEKAKTTGEIRYSEILKMVGLSITKKNQDYLQSILIAIGREEYAAGRPLINGLVINDTKRPGIGFFYEYKNLTKRNFLISDIKKQKEIHASIKRECSEYYSKDCPATGGES